MFGGRAVRRITTPPRWRFWGNLLGNQVAWLSAVWGAGHGWQWPALLTAALYLASQLLTSPRLGTDLRLVLMALACAIGVDGLAAVSGTLQYAASPWGAWPPPWILALWASFAMTLTTSLVFLQRHRALQVGFGLLLAPLAYVSAERGFSAVHFAEPIWHGIALLGVMWAVALLLLCRVAARRSTPLAR